MDLKQAYYCTLFENAFLRVKGTEFQSLFNKLMSLAYKADFMPCRPWGKKGDQKNDGFLKSERRLFQVYAPNEMTESKAKKKIREDFEGAIPYWGDHFDNWSFVHNAYNGLPPHVQRILLEFEKDNEGIKLEPWGYEELLVVFRRLENLDLQSWFGAAPTAETKPKLGYKDLQVVLERLASQTAPSCLPVKDVPRGKIQSNGLSESIAVLLKEGMSKAPLVEEFFSKWHDPSFGERIARSFREKYESLKEDLTPNEVFGELQAWAGGADRGTPEHELAVLTVMAYYFERCEIFEEPRSGRS